MPNLKHLTCTVEWSGSAVPLQEFQTAYGDGYVQTYVAVPPIPTPFSIHLRSNGYIAPGLAMYVYIDGDYQCNRFRHNLRIPDGTTTRRQTEVDFHVRQKEEMLEDGTFEGKQWRFENLNIVTAPTEHGGRLAPYNGEYVGTIEVVVLRCYPGEISRSAEGSSPESSPESATQSKKSAELKKPKAPKKATSPSSSEPSSSSSDSDSNAGLPEAMGGLFDGADDRPLGVPDKMVFERDKAGDDDLQSKQKSPRQWAAPFSRPKKARYIPPSQRGSVVGRNDDSSWAGSNTSRQHFNQDWGIYSSQIGANNSSEPQVTAGRSSKENSPVFGKHKTSPIVGTQNSPQVNMPAPAGQSSPAIVINVNHGTVNPSSVTPSVLAPAAPTENSWALPDKHSDKGSQKNSNGSNGSNGSKNRSDGVWGHKKKESWAMDMPGGWGASNVGSQANSTGWDDNGGNGAQANEDWNNGNDQPQDGNNGWENNGESAPQVNESWGSTAGGAQESSTGWNTNGNGNGQANSGWDNIGNGGGRNTSSWDRNGSGGFQEDKEGNGNEHTSGWNLGDAGSKINEAQSWGGATEKKNGWDMPKKNKNASHEKATSDKSNGFPKYTMEFTQSPNNMSTTSQDRVTGPASDPNNAQVHAPPLGFSVQPKPYWSTWNKLPEIPEEQKAPEPEPEPEPPVATEEPLPGVPIDVAQRNNMSHQVHTDKPVPYTHRTSAARPMDSLDSPYAVFIFKYRSSAILEKMLNTKLVEPEAEEKRRLSTLSKDELIEHFMKAKANARTSSTSSAASTAVPASFHSIENKNNATLGDSDFSNALSQKLNQLNMNSNESDKASTNPSNHWGRGDIGNGNGNDNSWNAIPSSPVNNTVTGWFSKGGGDPVTSPTHSWDYNNNNNNNNNHYSGGIAPVGSPTGPGEGQATAGASAGESHMAGRWGGWNGNGGGNAAAGSW